LFQKKLNKINHETHWNILVEQVSPNVSVNAADVIPVVGIMEGDTGVVTVRDDALGTTLLVVRLAVPACSDDPQPVPVVLTSTMVALNVSC
jgi:hypothetical protein